MSVEGYVSEVFSSFQGEGVYAGVRQVFLRTSGCSLSCVYCDTETSKAASRICKIYHGDTFEELENPLDGDFLLTALLGLSGDVKGLHSVSITGGEPLEQAGFLEPIMMGLREAGIPTYLETNGLVREGAERLAPCADFVALDIKLPSLCGGGEFFDIYRKTIPLFSREKLFFKIVVMDGLDIVEFEEAVRIAAELAPSCPLVIQPASRDGFSLAVDTGKLFDYHGRASEYMRDVRVIPQVHRVLGLR